MTFTNTYTTTSSRLSLLRMQIRIALRQTTDISEFSLKNTIEKGIEKQWIEKVYIYAFDNNNLCRGELIFKIDWNLHNSFISDGKATIALDPRYWIADDLLAIEVDEAVKLFNEFIDQNNLNTKWRASYLSSVDRDYANSQLGLKRGDPIKWAGENLAQKNIELAKLPELNIGLRLFDFE
ncbi:hypothetical protein [Spirulina sp. 06S082]|uniref:hypothetical protein n=1 Tax=Spirulina sp. 06S082 TaxID=3110248 RepID=UPI002B1F250B|nr:hypothetical protein [Spirulina sp. 06S082]MEA5470984.1 hypothetical protein [Spirulina sp. 06S082]